MIGAFTALASQFPPPESAREDGLLCMGGDLRPERLIALGTDGIVTDRVDLFSPA